MGQIAREQYHVGSSMRTAMPWVMMQFTNCTEAGKGFAWGSHRARYMKYQLIIWSSWITGDLNLETELGRLFKVQVSGESKCQAIFWKMQLCYVAAVRDGWFLSITTLLFWSSVQWSQLVLHLFLMRLELVCYMTRWRYANWLNYIICDTFTTYSFVKYKCRPLRCV